jgi:hypothetical protein
MKIYAGITGITDALIAQGNYAAADAVQQILRNMDFPAIDGAGQLISLAGSETIEVENLTSGAYRLNMIGGGTGGGFDVLGALPETLTDGTAQLFLIEMPSDDGILLSPRSAGWNGVNSSCVGDYAFQQWSPRCPVVAAAYPTKDETKKKFATYSSHFVGTDGAQGQGLAVWYAPPLGAGDFFIDLWVCSDANMTGGQMLINNMDGSGGGVGWLLRFKDADGKVEFYSTEGSIVHSAGIYNTGDEFMHLRVERFSGVVYLFMDGVLSDSAACTTDFNATWPLKIANSYIANASQGSPFNGWIEGIQIVPGRSASSGEAFTPPTEEAPVVKKWCLVLMRGTSGNPVYEVINRMPV